MPDSNIPEAKLTDITVELTEELLTDLQEFSADIAVPLDEVLRVILAEYLAKMLPYTHWRTNQPKIDEY
jgi:hypothetical protein